MAQWIRLRPPFFVLSSPWFESQANCPCFFRDLIDLFERLLRPNLLNCEIEQKIENKRNLTKIGKIKKFSVGQTIHTNKIEELILRAC